MALALALNKGTSGGHAEQGGYPTARGGGGSEAKNVFVFLIDLQFWAPLIHFVSHQNIF